MPSPAKKTARVRAARWLAFTLLWVCFIWGHSLIQGPESSAESGFVYSIVRPIFDALGASADVATFVIRKIAHFSEYAVLGVAIHGLAGALRDLPAGGSGPRASWRPRLAWAFGCLVPVADESLQLFVPGRCGSPRDVAIDLAGFVTGALLAHAAPRLLRRLRRGGSNERSNG